MAGHDAPGVTGRSRTHDRPERQERRDYRAEAPRGEFQRPESTPRRERRREEPAVVAEDAAALPAFLMAPVRPVAATTPIEPEQPAVVETAAEEAPAAKPRRRRRPRFESAAAETGEGGTPSTDDTPTE